MEKQLTPYGWIKSILIGWFTDTSGMYYDDDYGWRVSAEGKREVVKKKKDSTKEIKYNLFKANDFQTAYMSAKQEILNGFSKHEKYIVDCNDVFDLMQNKKVEVEYQYQGRNMKKLIKI